MVDRDKGSAGGPMAHEGSSCEWNAYDSQELDEDRTGHGSTDMTHS